MKTYCGLFDTIAGADNLYAAYRAARRGKRYKAHAARFELDAESNLLRLEKELRAGTYRPSRYRLLLIREPKRRVIAAAPFRDRVVHHAVCRVVMPLLGRSFIHDTYACIQGRGSHRAVLRHLGFMRRFAYRCHLDVRAFFPSIPVDLLLEAVARRIRDRRTMDLLARIADSGLYIYRDAETMAYLGLPPHGAGERRGLPIGNLTSQHLANVYLNGLDHFIKRDLGVRGYVRYMDDMVLFGDGERHLAEAATRVVEYLDERLRLEVKAPPRLTATRGRVCFLGYQVSRAGIRIAPATLEKIKTRVGRLRRGGSSRIERSLLSYRGLCL